MKTVRRSALLAVSALIMALTACQTENQTEQSQTKQFQSEQPQSVQEQPDENMECVENPKAAEFAYKAFLEEKDHVITAEQFRKDDAGVNMDGLSYGEYSYEALKSAIEEFEGTSSVARYALLDCGQDGTTELALRLEALDFGYNSWVGIIYYDGENLQLNYSYEEGYRNFADLYTSGYLVSGGAVGAGGYTTALTELDNRGYGKELFRQNVYYGSTASGVFVDLINETSDFWMERAEAAALTQIEVREYLMGDSVKISVSGWNEDAGIRSIEEEFIDSMVESGAEMISEEEMNELCSLTSYETEIVEWKDVESGDTAENPVLTIGYAEEPLPADSDSYELCILSESENAILALIKTNADIHDLTVVELEVLDVSESGAWMYDWKPVREVPKLTSDKMLIIQCTIDGTIPNTGIMYTDQQGQTHMYAILMSGMDGSLILNEI